MNYMRNGNKIWISLALAISAALASAPCMGQDFPTLKGDNARTGKNATANASGPGLANLRWWRPNLADNIGGTRVLDNPDAGVTFSGAWSQPLTVADEAFNAYISDPNADPSVVFPYRYAKTVLSSDQDDPTQGSTSYVEWSISPPGAVQRNVALYAWLPIGPTLELGNPLYPQRFFVYEILYGTGGSKRWIDVVDTFQAGTSWVRLGGGGRPTRQLFDYDGSTPIRIRLHNTVPMDSSGRYTDSPGTLVYGDAVMAVPEYGTYVASPIVNLISSLPTIINTVDAITRHELAYVDGKPKVVEVGEVHSRFHDSNNGLLDVANNDRWVFRPNQVSPELTVNVDNLSAVPGPGWTPQTTPSGFIGTNYLSQPTTNSTVLMSNVSFEPTLEDGSYEVWVHLQGSSGPTVFAQQQRVDVEEGASVTNLTLDANAGGGWVRLGSRRFDHTKADPLRVKMTNFSALPADAGLLAYADAVRFVGAGSTAIHSTPVQAKAFVKLTPAGAPVEREVTIVCAEDGRIYCLDSLGNADGTTKVYWTYPSTPRPNESGWTDPNHVSGVDGVGPIAEMPIGFDMTSAMIQRISGVDYLYVGSTNGRVYCIEMAGRGDMDDAKSYPGTAVRRWTYPNDYPSSRRTSTLGPIKGSLAFATIASGPTVFVPTSEGRLYALNALGTPATKTTSVRWNYPSLTTQPLGAIQSTPAVEFGRVYFGSNVGSDNLGHFVCLNQDTGALVWQYSGGAAQWNRANAENFASGPVTIASTLMTGMPNTVVAANDNGYITAFDAASGLILWATNELGSAVAGNLTYSPLTVYNNSGALYSSPQPCVIVPTNDGRISALFAEWSKTNSLGGTRRRAWGFDTRATDLKTSVAVGRNWMYITDPNGYMYGLNNSTSGHISPGDPPGTFEIVENDPLGIPFREAKLVFIKPDTYQKLRLPTGASGHMTHAQANNTSAQVTTVNPAYEWGETIYLMVYNFPYNPSGLPEPPYTAPQAEFRFNVEGASVRNITSTAKRFSGTSPVSGITGATLDGYAIISFTVQGSGSTAIAPGNANTNAILSAQFGAGDPLQNVVLNPALVNKVFQVANPIAVATQFDASGNPLPNHSLGYTIQPNHSEAVMNGSRDILSSTKREDRITASAGVVHHNQKATRQMAVFDRSMMRQIRGPERGVDNVRIGRADLTWRGGAGSIWKPLDPLAYPNFEDRPTRFPNTSLDFPDLKQERVDFIKDRFGNAEDPANYGVALIPPTSVGAFSVTNRTLVRTPLDIDINVPRYQPANLSTILDSDPANLAGVPGGYAGTITVYVDSNGDGRFGNVGNRREAFRTFVAAASVAVDEKFYVGTPTLDLGSLGSGTGFRADSTNPWPWLSTNTGYGPNVAPYTDIFQTFRVFNDGNVNLLNLRLAKGFFDPTSGTVRPWGLFAPAGHERSWLDTQLNLWSDIDKRFAPVHSGSNSVILQKPRVGDSSANELLVNPRRRVNENLNQFAESYLMPTSGPAGVLPNPPRVSVSVPIGMPVGSYLSQMRVIEDVDDNETLAYSLLANGTWNPTEAQSDPGFTLRFSARESRITNAYTKYTAPMMQNLSNGTEKFLHQNMQPAAMRDRFGNLLVAYMSNSSAFNAPEPLTESLNDGWRLYIGSMTGTRPETGLGSSFLPDLNAWLPGAGGTFFRQEVGPFPTVPSTALFGLSGGETIIAGTDKFGAPALPLLGAFNPYTGAEFGTQHIAFLGEAQIQSGSGRRSMSLPFVASFTTAADGAISMGNISPLPSVEGGVKGRPAIVKTSDADGTLFFAAGGGGQTQIYAQAFHDNGTTAYNTGQLLKLAVGTGFEYVSGPSAYARTYAGASVPGLPNGAPMFELGFTGKLRGRPNPEVFHGRVRAGGTYGGPQGQGGQAQFIYLPEMVDDRMVADGEAGNYRSTGLQWNLNATIQLDMILNGVRTNLEVANTRVIDRTTGLVTFDTKLGGKAYLDPNMGTVRLAGTLPPRNASLLLRYTPRLLLASGSAGAGYSTPTVIFDNRMIGEFSYWARSNNQPLVPNGGPIPNDPVRSARMVFTYGRAAAGAGQTSRPYMRTFRLGVQLPVPVHTQANGAITSFNVTGATSYYQIDPGRGRAYFQDLDENRTVTITYTGVDEATGAAIPGIVLTNVQVALVPERDEAPVPMDQAFTESQLFAFPDPFDFGNAAQRRPGLIWLFWMSTRTGTPDIFFQTIAPRFTPTPVGKQ
ncbi:MAG: PQQ-binding-like beta-propeller repeat protein [Armatimonadetes bacterium]|nr:PQQ-binding-like beta-propeller repeat protein [Armatimonadota bacterium]